MATVAAAAAGPVRNRRRARFLMVMVGVLRCSMGLDTQNTPHARAVGTGNLYRMRVNRGRNDERVAEIAAMAVKRNQLMEYRTPALTTSTLAGHSRQTSGERRRLSRFDWIDQ